MKIITEEPFLVAGCNKNAKQSLENKKHELLLVDSILKKTLK
jgi:hypothetical protein